MTTTPVDPNAHDTAHRKRIKRILGIVGLIVLCVLAVILLLGMLPVSSRGMASQPDPAVTYDEAVARFELVAAAEEGIVNDLGHSRLLVHGERTPRAYVMVHGITNSPEQWLELGQTLYDQGHNILILRMPYHGMKSHLVSELKALKPQDLRFYADQAVDIGAGLGDEVVVVGISGGGGVGAWMAQNRTEIDRALLLAPFFGVHGVPNFANKLLANAFSRLPNIVLDNPLEPRHNWVYRGEATRGVAAFLEIGRTVIQGAAKGTGPAGRVIVLTTTKDDTASNNATVDLVDLWRKNGINVNADEFAPELDIPHNSVDPAADPVTKQMVYDRILELLGEQSSP